MSIIVPLSLTLTFVFLALAVFMAIIADAESTLHHGFVTVFVVLCACSAMTCIVTAGLYFSTN